MGMWLTHWAGTLFAATAASVGLLCAVGGLATPGGVVAAEAAVTGRGGSGLGVVLLAQRGQAVWRAAGHGDSPTVRLVRQVDSAAVPSVAPVPAPADAASGKGAAAAAVATSAAEPALSGSAPAVDASVVTSPPAGGEGAAVASSVSPTPVVVADATPAAAATPDALSASPGVTPGVAASPAATAAGEPPPSDADVRAGFTLSLLSEDRNDEAFSTIPIVGPTDGVRAAFAENCTLPAEASPDSSVTTTTATRAAVGEPCHAEGVYADRMSFQMVLSRHVFDHLNSGTPAVTVSGGNAHPALDHWNLDPEGLTGAFTILYRCAAGTPGAVSTIGLAFGLSPSVVVRLRWVKRCGGGPNTLIDIRYVDDDVQEVPFGGIDVAGATTNLTTIGPMESATRVMLHLRSPAQTLDYAVPMVVSSDASILGVELRGGPVVTAGTLSADAPAELRVLYTCTLSGEAVVSLRLQIPPWDDVTAMWKKDCGGGAPPGLDVRLVAGGGVPADALVMEGGAVQSAFAVDENTSTPAAGTGNGTYYTLPAAATEATFVLTNNGAHLHLASVTLTVADPHVLIASVEAPSSRGPAGFFGVRGPPYLGSSGVVLERGDAARLKVRLVCIRAGPATVLVTLPSMAYAHVEWGFVKVCDAPTRIVRGGGGIRTAGGVAKTLVVLAALGGGGWAVMRAVRARRQTRYAALSAGAPTATF
ncbi:hypothetical protein I4F81_002439 [Pyropia yezoensis]|uniref:Uncharacterized protein n=1 Tax=Pyropia yezoensis TaxID=2788 RepID=A0ACC3BPE3_PYRYE|nr:hypothetical protein I4F81_002439 [Neopyropia yezoensis]